MQKRIPLKNHLQEIRLVTRRAIVACIIMSILILLLIIRFAYLQVYKQHMFSTLSEKNWLDLVPLEPTRGLIYDRHGKLLAENIPVFSLDIIPNKVPSLTKTMTGLAKIISLSESDIWQFQKQLKQYRRFDEIPLKLRLSDEEVARFAENQHRFPGVLIKARLMRHYPFAENFSHVLGYVGRINIQELTELDSVNYSATQYMGKLGIEKYYENELHGTVGYEEDENDASGRSVRIIKQIKPIPGKNLYLTLDGGLQLAAEQALKGLRGAVIAIQPDTGQVLAMVSEPSYDPNIFVSGISQQQFQALQNLPDKPLYNRAVRGLYPLGSTIKPYFALQALESGIITAEDSIYDPGWFQLENSEHIFYDHPHTGHGTVDLNKAITLSCDTYFYKLASKMGIRRMDAILNAFGFGEVTGIDMEEELPGVLASPEWKQRAKKMPWFPGDTVNAGIGQGFMQATPLQLANAVATLANRGKRYMPTLLLGLDELGRPYAPQPPTPLESVPVHNPQNWNNIIKAMQNVVDSKIGTGFRFGPHDLYTIAGKTGTAQVYSKNYRYGAASQKVQDKLRDHALFVAFAPVDKPKIAIAIVVEHYNTAVIVARQIFDYYLGKPTPMIGITAQATKATINQPRPTA